MLTVSRYETAALAFQGLEMRFALALLGAEHAAAYSQIREHCEVPQQRDRCNCQHAVDSEQAGLR